MKRTLLSLLFAAFVVVGFSQAEYVNPLVGTAEHGHTFPGALIPMGAVQVSPDTRLDGWDGCSGYHYSDNRIYGFSHTHLSGTGCLDYGDILVMPFQGTPSINNEQYSSTFSHKNETATAGYYSVKLDNGIFAELTASNHIGVHRYAYSAKGTRGIIIDMTHRDKTLSSELIYENGSLRGFRTSESWNIDQYCAFSLLASSPIKKVEMYQDGKLTTATKLSGTDCKAIVYFADNVKSVTLKVAISAVDVDGAVNNQTELKGFDFNKVKADATAAWNKELNRIKVESSNKEYLKTFYTALYHTYTSPYLYSDVDGRYRGQDGKIHRGDGKHSMYTVFSLWDTYRSLHPLLNIIDQKRTEDFLYTFLQHYREGTMLPVWELSSFETWCMIGYHSIPVIWDAYQKGIHNYDVNEMLKAMVHSAKLNKLGRPEYAKFGYIPGDAENESVSKTLEYAYDDWCIAQFAKAIGNTAVYKEFIKRAQSYKNIMDERGFMHGKMNGGWFQPFDPTEVNNYFTEGNCWQYSTYAPQDINGYIGWISGDIYFERFLDTLFYGSSKMTGREQPDVTGVIGQYAHGNEPSHHAAYLYAYIGKMWKTQELTHKIMTELYTSAPDGLCGNEDCGQMSAWYVLSSMGFYPVCPGSNEYVFGYPLFDKVTLNLENGKALIITRDKDLPYIGSVKLNGKTLNQWYITYDQIKNGGTLEFIMSNEKPTEVYYADRRNSALPYSIIDDKSALITPVPYFSTDKKRFNDKTLVTITAKDVEQNWSNNNGQKTTTPANKIYYTLDGSTPAPTHGTLYTGPIAIDQDITIKAIAYNEQTGASDVAEANYIRFVKDKSIQYFTQPSPQYSEGGEDGLIDHMRGKENWRIGGWQGFAGSFEGIIDLESVKPVSEVTASCLEDVRAWIFFPSSVEVMISEDGKNYVPFGTVQGIGSVKSEEQKLHEFTVKGNANGRYLKVKVNSFGPMPDWHVSPGAQSWLFMDEIIVK